ncbi:MAG: RNA polymerase factor sigma-54 [Candidatus Schekmanbacteria bacterium]|nr:RNA polymerase factor sigma-54 [Candidatus Schekmanbacteria bacterium]
MAELGLRLDVKLTQRLLMTPSLQQAIKLLQLSRLDLVQLVRQELTDNPMLEEISQELSSGSEPMESENYNQDSAPSNEPAEETPQADNPPEVDWSEYFNDNTDLGMPNFRDHDLEPPTWENTLAKLPTLQDHLLWQLRLIDITPEEFNVGEEIIGNIDEHGYLQASLEEICQSATCPPDRAEKVLGIIQGFEPLGVGARDLKECLLLQVKGKGEDCALQVRIIEDHLNDLEHKKYRAIVSALKIPLSKVSELVQIIASYDPRPGRQFTSSEVRYVVPDVFVYKLENEYVIILNDEGMPRLRISNLYRQILSQHEASKSNTRKYIETKMRSALWLIKSIQQRQMTLYKVTESIVKFQRGFLDEGMHKLRPLNLKDVADDISVHESTVSRVTTNKYVHTPRGIFELKYFFHSGLEQSDGRTVSSLRIKDMIKALVDNEDKRHPLTDAQILKILTARNIDVARRTITKYREAMTILPASQRRQY